MEIINKVFLGDCQELLPHILERLDRKKVILVSDPPFNIKYHYNTYKDNLDEEEYYEALESVFGEDRCVLIHYPENLYKFSFQIGKFPEKIVSWVYNSNTPKQHRDIAFFGVSPDFNQVRQPYKNQTDKRIIKLMEEKNVGGGRLYDWWEIQQVKNVSNDKTKHPCQTPLEVMRRIIGILPKDSIIIDPFCGSGTTCLACKELGYKYIGIEIDEEYYQIALDRLNGVNANGQMSIFTDFDKV